MRFILDKLYLTAGAVAALLIMAICVLVTAQVCANIITKFFGTSLVLTIPSYADFSGYFLAASSFLALAYTFQSGGHIRVMLFRERFSKPTNYILGILVLGIATLTASFMTYYLGLQVFEAYEFGDVSSGIIVIPLFIPQSFVLIGMGIFALSLADATYQEIKNKPTP